MSGQAFLDRLKGRFGARITGAKKIIAVDMVDSKLEMAREFGATDTVNGSKGDPVSAVMDLTEQRGADVTFDNFLMLAGEPRLTVTLVDPNVEVSWPIIPYRLQSSPSLPAAWTDVASGIARLSNRYVYSVPAVSGPKFFRLVYP